MNNRTFAETFPCGTDLNSCKIGNQGYCPVDYDNFVANTDIPFFIEKEREKRSLMYCRDDNNKYIYYTPVDVYLNQYVRLVKPYYIVTDGVQSKNKYKYIKNEQYYVYK